jgi:predicted nucleic acid-binding protein
LTIYADSSFFVSLHIVDLHSQEVWRRMLSQPAIWLTPLHEAEFVHAAFLHVFWKKATLFEAEAAVDAFKRDREASVWIAVDVPKDSFERSVDLARRYGPSLGVRTLDSLHVACALELKADKFWTFDERQEKLAEAVGLDTTSR